MIARAKLIDRKRQRVSNRAFVEYVIWQLPVSLDGSTHAYKYRMAYVVDDVCVLRYDNEAGKGDHKHEGDREVSYTFTTLDALVDDFWLDVDRIGG
jgi:hypothetical protein